MSLPPQWAAERTISVDAVAAVVGSIAPELAGEPVVALAQGWDNTVFVVGDQWAFRFPRRAVALPGFRLEIAVLPAIAPLLPLAVPVPELVATDRHPQDPWPCTGARLIPGRELAETAPDQPREALAAAVGAFLRVLHQPGLRAAAANARADLPLDPMQRGWPRARLDQTRKTLARLVAGDVWRDDPAVPALLVLDEASALPEPDTEPVLVHGDLHVRHLLVDDAGAATGIIDWGDLCLAHPAVDLGIAYAAFEAADRATLLTAYGPIDAETELRARALAVRLSVMIADYAVRDRRPRLLSEALDGLRRASH